MKIDLLKFLDEKCEVYIGINSSSNNPFYIGLVDKNMFDKYFNGIAKYIQINSRLGYSKVLEKFIRRSFRNNIISNVEFFENNININFDNDSYITIAYSNYQDILNTIKLISKKMDYDFKNKYINIKDNIDNVYLYDSVNTSSFDFMKNDISKVDCHENNLYISYNLNNSLLDNYELIKQIIYDFTNSKVCDKYLVDDEKVVLGFKNNKSISLYCKDKKIYSDILEVFKNKLIDDKVEKNKIKRKVINNGKFNNGKIS